MRPSSVAVLLLLTTGCTHTVTVLAPAADVPADAPIEAVVTSGQVTQFSPDKTKSNVANLAPSDLVAVRASGGERFGNIVVDRKPGYDAIMVLGIAVILGGVTTSFVLAGTCNGSASSLQPGCAAIAVGGASASLAGGGLLIAYGHHGEIVVKPTGIAGRF